MEQLAIPPLGVEPLVLDEDLFLLAMSRALENTLPLLQSKMQSVIHNVFEQFRLTTPPPGRYQQRPLEQSSTPISDPKTQIEIVHSHLWKARSKQVALKSTAVIGGVKKRHRSRRGTYGFLATDTHPKRKVSFQRLVAEIAQDVKVDWRSQSSVMPSLLGSTVSTQVNNTNASFCSVSNTGTLSFVNNGCGAVDSVFVGSIHVGFSVRHDNQGPNSGEKVRECHALHLFDEMLHSNELGNVGRTVPALTSIRDKGGGLAHQPLEYALGVNCAKDNEGVDMKANQLEDDNAISEIAGFFAGGIAGALAGKVSDSGIVRGAGLGAVAGAVLSVEILEASRELLHLGRPGSRRSSLMAEITEELICWRFEEDNLLPPEVLTASHWQVNFANHHHDEIRDGVVETRGLSRDFLKKLPCHEILGDTKSARVSCCTICLQDLEVGETARTLPLCQHTFHLACVDKWLVRHGSCPLCRQYV